MESTRTFERLCVASEEARGSITRVTAGRFLGASHPPGPARAEQWR